MKDKVFTLKCLEIISIILIAGAAVMTSSNTFTIEVAFGLLLGLLGMIIWVLKEDMIQIK